MAKKEMAKKEMAKNPNYDEFSDLQVREGISTRRGKFFTEEKDVQDLSKLFDTTSLIEKEKNATSGRSRATSGKVRVTSGRQARLSKLDPYSKMEMEMEIEKGGKRKTKKRVKKSKRSKKSRMVRKRVKSQRK